jgi:putative ABC transport system permease protein
MNDAYIALGYSDLLLGAALILINAGLSVALNLGLQRQVLLSATRMVVQLSLMGMILSTLFATRSALLTLAAVIVMVGFAGYEVASRQEKPFDGRWNWVLSIGAMSLPTCLITFLALTITLKADPWYDPHYAIPLLGMILGNAMTGIALGLNILTTGSITGRAAIEAQLMLGASRYQALAPIIRKSLKTAMMPIINAMSTTGIVSLPGMMTGQILGGVPPAEAVKYQILIMCLIAGAIGIGAISAVFIAAHRLSDQRHRLRLDRLRA